MNNMKDGDEMRWSVSDNDGSDMEECEARLYAMVYHTSNSYNDAPVNAQSSGFSGPSANDNEDININCQLNPTPGFSIIEEDGKERSNIDRNECHHSAKNLASRLSAVEKIISDADHNEIIGTNKPNTAQNDKNASPKKQNLSGESPKTASLYFQNLTKSLNNVQYLQSVQPWSEKTNSTSVKKTISRFSSPVKTTHSCNGTAALTNFTFAESTVTNNLLSTPVFRLDDRLFPNKPVPKNNSISSLEEFELSSRLFSNRGIDCDFVDRNRHRTNHLFDQLPTIPITKSVTIKKQKRQQRAAKRKEKKAQLKLKKKLLKVSSTEHKEHSLEGQQLLNVSVPAILHRLNVAMAREWDDSPVAVFDTRDMPQTTKVDTGKVIDVDLTINSNEIINLDSDSDSADSIVVITPPARTPPPVIALDEETPLDQAANVHPVLESEHVENSFDFLDSSDETEGLVKTQAFLFTNLISNSGSKESLLDDHLFKNQVESDLEKSSVTKVASIVPIPSPTSCDDLAPKHLIVETQTTSVEKVLCEVMELNVVNLDDSSQSMESITTISDNTIHVNEDILVLHSGNVMSKKLVDLEINSLLTETSNSQAEGSGLKLAEADVEDDCSTRPKKKKSKDGMTRKNKSTSKQEKRKRSIEKRLQMHLPKSQQKSGMGTIVYSKIIGDELIPMEEVRSRNPAKWTREMRHFYNNSWGGENFDVVDMQQKMSRNPSLWRVSWEDKRGPVNLKGPFKRARCFNCLRFGHPAYHCPEPVRPLKCYMCGQLGHREANCNQTICLQCGRPSNKYSNGCWQCQHIPFDLCVKCIWKHDPTKSCFDLRHKPVTEIDSVSAPATCDRRFGPGAPQTELGDLRFQLEHRRSHLASPDGVVPPARPSRHSDYRREKKRLREDSVCRPSSQSPKRQRSYQDPESRRYVGSTYFKQHFYRQSR